VRKHCGNIHFIKKYKYTVIKKHDPILHENYLTKRRKSMFTSIDNTKDAYDI